MEFDKAEKISRPNEYRVNAERIPWGPAAHARIGFGSSRSTSWQSACACSCRVWDWNSSNINKDTRQHHISESIHFATQPFRATGCLALSLRTWCFLTLPSWPSALCLLPLCCNHLLTVLPTTLGSLHAPAPSSFTPADHYFLPDFLDTCFLLFVASLGTLSWFPQLTLLVWLRASQGSLSLQLIHWHLRPLASSMSQGPSLTLQHSLFIEDLNARHMNKFHANNLTPHKNPMR